MIWADLAATIENEIAGNPRTYLRQQTISKTMQPTMRPLTRAYWEELQVSRYFREEIRRALPDGAVGLPYEFELAPNISPQSVQHAYYINLLAQRLGIRIAKVPHIVELGGGYGNMARIVRKMGHRGRYQIFDLPQIHALQRKYLEETLGDHGVEFIGVDEIGPADLLIATFSVSEMPMDLRDRLETTYAGFGALMFATNKGSFDGVDNDDYFPKLAKRIGGKYVKDPHRSAWFVLCKR